MSGLRGSREDEPVAGLAFAPSWIGPGGEGAVLFAQALVLPPSAGPVLTAPVALVLLDAAF